MSDGNVLLIGDRVVTPDAEGPAAVAVVDGRIIYVGPERGAPRVGRVVRLQPDEVLLPGLVDTHVHLQLLGCPGWEGLATGTRAAARGGTTTVVDMPVDSRPPTVDLASLEAKRAVLTAPFAVDLGLWGGAVPGLSGLSALVNAGVLGLKAFLSPSGCDGFPPLSPADLRQALTALLPSGLPLLVHAEDEQHALPLASTRRHGDFLASRPAVVEASAIAVVVDAVRRTGGRAHVVHVSSADGVAVLRAARAEGLVITAETCPHYLVVDGDRVPDGATRCKALPAVRGRSDAEALWAALTDGVIELVVSDHSPCAPGGKQTGDFALDKPGVSSLELRLPLLWTAARQRGHSFGDVARWTAQAPARLAGLPRKGRLVVGADADLCVLAPDEPVRVGALAHLQAGTPWDGQLLRGAVRSTWLRGQPCDPDRPRGRVLVA